MENQWFPLQGYRHLGVAKEVCGGEATLIGHRITPKNIYNYGTIEQTAKDYHLTIAEVEECRDYYDKQLLKNALHMLESQEMDAYTLNKLKEEIKERLNFSFTEEL